MPDFFHFFATSHALSFCRRSSALMKQRKAAPAASEPASQTATRPEKKNQSAVPVRVVGLACLGGLLCAAMVALTQTKRHTLSSAVTNASAAVPSLPEAAIKPSLDLAPATVPEQVEAPDRGATTNAPKRQRARIAPADPRIKEQPLPEPRDEDGVLAEALRVLDEAYREPDEAQKNSNPFGYAAAKKEVKKAVGSEKPAVYGEIRSATALAMLEHLGARPGQRYYDLGSGTGKTVVLAWLLGLEATGVELVTNRWRTACDALGGLRNVSAKPLRGDGSAGMRHVRGSLLEADISDADIVFADSVMFSEDMMDGIAKSVQGLKPGALLVTSNRPDLPPDGLRLLERFTGLSSWANESVWKVHVVEGAPGKEDGPRPRPDVLPGAKRCDFHDAAIN